MAIQAGEPLPSVKLFTKTGGEIKAITTADLFAGKKVVLFALPGAFTPVCSRAHLPGFVVKADEILDSGVDSIIYLSVNDPHVMTAWGEQSNVEDKILMIADGNGDFTRAVGMEVDRSESGMGIRSQRYAMVVDNGTVMQLNLEAPGKFEVSDAETILKVLAAKPR